jgi:hypothetical protein
MSNNMLLFQLYKYTNNILGSQICLLSSYNMVGSSCCNLKCRFCCAFETCCLNPPFRCCY